jgi:hypothetical protein
MNNDGLNKLATLQLPIGHLLVVWDVLANKLSDTDYKNKFTEEEKRAIWALEDICENELVENGFGPRPEKEWDQLMEQATVFVKSTPADFVK